MIHVRNYYNYLKKIILFGDSNTGKSSILNRLKYNIYLEDIRKTIGVNFHEKIIFHDNIGYTLQIWDFSGEKRFLGLLPLWLKGTEGGICCFDICNQESLNSIPKWINLIKYHLGHILPLILIGNKIDKISERKISFEQAQKEADNYNIKYYETSAKNNGNINEIFSEILNQILIKPN